MKSNLLLLFGISIAWAVDYLFVADAERLPPLIESAVIVSCAALVLTISALLLRRPLLHTLRQRPWLPLVMAATAIALPRISVVLAEHAITPDMAALIGTTVPLLTFLLTTFVTRSTPYSHLRMLGVALALTGLLIFIGPGDLLQQRAELIGILTMMAGGVVFVANGLLADAKAGGLDGLSLTTWVMLFAAIGLLLVALLAEGVPAQLPPTPSLLAMLTSGVVGVALAYLGYYRLIDRAGAWFTSLYAFLVPPLGLLAAVLFANEALTLQHLAGIAVLLSGLWLVVRRQQASPEPMQHR